MHDTLYYKHTKGKEVYKVNHIITVIEIVIAAIIVEILKEVAEYLKHHK